MDVDALKESHLIGRQELISEVINLLCHKQSPDQREVTSICGKSGLGKTILVKHIYQHYKLDGIFDKRAYVTIKRPFDRRELISSLISYATA
jgi:Cdc6-like AAA superfamily ATPase